MNQDNPYAAPLSMSERKPFLSEPPPLWLVAFSFWFGFAVLMAMFSYSYYREIVVIRPLPLLYDLHGVVLGIATLFTGAVYVHRSFCE
jgi:hypothetical protein